MERLVTAPDHGILRCTLPGAHHCRRDVAHHQIVGLIPAIRNAPGNRLSRSVVADARSRGRGTEIDHHVVRRTRRGPGRQAHGKRIRLHRLIGPVLVRLPDDRLFHPGRDLSVHRAFKRRHLVVLDRNIVDKDLHCHHGILVQIVLHLQRAERRGYLDVRDLGICRIGLEAKRAEH